VQQLSSRRFLDAHQSSGRDFAAVTRESKDNDSQRWLIGPGAGGRFSLTQMSSKRLLDAHEIEAKDFAAVTRPPQSDTTQQWTLAAVPHVDLAAANFDIQPGAGRSFSAKGIVHNIGQLPVRGPFRIVLEVTTASSSRSVDTQIPASTTIAPGATIFTLPIENIPKTPGSTCVIRMLVDPDFKLPDAMRANNALERQLSF
jgi:hypothetical protein